ncbi:hypothetical protein FHG87_025235 [Trinorchestia longiramus]|nr:hypothetical protein FHG87_025235 [Trinorchestia longiramus]
MVSAGTVNTFKNRLDKYWIRNPPVLGRCSSPVRWWVAALLPPSPGGRGESGSMRMPTRSARVTATQQGVWYSWYHSLQMMVPL